MILENYFSLITHLLAKSKGLILLLLLGLTLLTNCGKPNEAESLFPEDISGGYKVVSKFITAGYSQDLLIKDSLVYIAQGEGGLMIVNVADPKNPKTVSITSEDVRGYSTKIAIKDSAIYLAAGSFGVTVLNIARPETPIGTASNLSMKPAKNIYILGDYMFTAVSEQGVKIAEVSFPTQPDIRGGVQTTGFGQGVATNVDSSYLLVANGELGLEIFDISNFQGGFGIYPQVGWTDTPGYAEAVIVSENESIAFMACGVGGLQIIDFSDTSDVHIIGSYDGVGYAKELNYHSQRIYMTAELGGLQIIDVSDLTKPSLIGMIETEFALGVDNDENYIYVADEDEGLIIISIPD